MAVSMGFERDSPTRHPLWCYTRMSWAVEKTKYQKEKCAFSSIQIGFGNNRKVSHVKNTSACVRKVLQEWKSNPFLPLLLSFERKGRSKQDHSQGREMSITPVSKSQSLTVNGISADREIFSRLVPQAQKFPLKLSLLHLLQCWWRGESPTPRKEEKTPLTRLPTLLKHFQIWQHLLKRDQGLERCLRNPK